MNKFILFLLSAAAISAQVFNSNDGRIFDSGYELTQESSSASPQLKDFRYLIGKWDVDITTTIDDTTAVNSRGFSSISYMNRGHAIFESFSAENFNGIGDELNTIFFLAFNNSNNQWNLGIADSYKENISLYNGTNKGRNLLLKNSIRLKGGILIHNYKFEIIYKDNNSFSVIISHSSDFMPAWQKIVERVYTRKEEVTGFMTSEIEYGRPAVDRPEEAAQFDFLIGKWTAYQQIQLSPGQWAKFPSNATAVYALNGHAIMEYNWYDIDPRLPEAATTIIRIYNRAMRRWECMYLTNRFNSILYFGGVKENDEIVLTLFETDNSESPINYFIFYDIEEDNYQWHALRSTDRGKTFDETWTINTVRNSEED